MDSVIYYHPFVAIDFDNTIVDRDGRDLGAFKWLNHLSKHAALMLWTCRSDGWLDEAVEYCRKNGLTFYGVNQNPAHQSKVGVRSPKMVADIYVDDRALENGGGYPGRPVDWDEVGPKLCQAIHRMSNFGCVGIDLKVGRLT